MVLTAWSKVSIRHIEFLILTVSLIRFKSYNGLAYPYKNAKQGLVMFQRKLPVPKIMKEAFLGEKNKLKWNSQAFLQSSQVENGGRDPGMHSACPLPWPT